MASFASSATTCGARKHAWTNFQYKLRVSKKMKLLHLGAKITICLRNGSKNKTPQKMLKLTDI